MACCVTAPNYCLNQCWLTLHEIFWHSFQGGVYLNTQDINPTLCLKFTYLKLQPYPSGDKRLKINSQPPANNLKPLRAYTSWYIDGLMQKRRNYGALTMGLRLFWIKPSIYTRGISGYNFHTHFCHRCHKVFSNVLLSLMTAAVWWPQYIERPCGFILTRD